MGLADRRGPQDAATDCDATQQRGCCLQPVAGLPRSRAWRCGGASPRAALVLGKAANEVHDSPHSSGCNPGNDGCHAQRASELRPRVCHCNCKGTSLWSRRLIRHDIQDRHGNAQARRDPEDVLRHNWVPLQIIISKGNDVVLEYPSHCEDRHDGYRKVPRTMQPLCVSHGLHNDK